MRRNMLCRVFSFCSWIKLTKKSLLHSKNSGIVVWISSVLFLAIWERLHCKHYSPYLLLARFCVMAFIAGTLFLLCFNPVFRLWLSNAIGSQRCLSYSISSITHPSFKLAYFYMSFSPPFFTSLNSQSIILLFSSNRDSNSPILAGNLPFANQVSGLPFSHHDLPFFLN